MQQFVVLRHAACYVNVFLLTHLPTKPRIKDRSFDAYSLQTCRYFRFVGSIWNVWSRGRQDAAAQLVDTFILLKVDFIALRWTG